ncbi:MAG: hypothetical protein RI894_511, partial [Bacteroidota bacterium]
MKTNSFLFAFLSAWLLLSNGTAYAQNIWYAAPTAAGNGNGMSWANASSLAIVLDSLAHAGDEVWVKQGRHKPVFDYSRKPAPQDPRTKQFTLPDGVRLYGGFAGNETLRTQRNWRTNITTLSGDLNGNDGANFANNAENVYHILLSVDSHLLTTLDGFSVSGGNADGSNTGYQVGNTWVAGENGAGIFALTSAMTIENCLFKSNKTIGSGGALSLEGSGLTMKNCEFSNNKAGYGGAISSNNSSNSTINRCVFQGNVSNYEGGALENYINSSPTVTNCLFINNTSLAGGAIENYSSAPTITNCTFTANNSQSGTGVYSQVSSAPTITNCIFWGNSTASACILDRNSVSTISYTTIQGTIAYAGVGNIRTDPMFLNIADLDGADNQFMTTDDGLQLGVCSYAIDGGTNSVLHTTDIVGTAIPVLATVDMGAYENTTNAALPAATITASSVGNI